jgi:hypothetical protein
VIHKECSANGRMKDMVYKKMGRGIHLPLPQKKLKHENEPLIEH